jgi:hypothetical protein
VPAVEVALEERLGTAQAVDAGGGVDLAGRNRVGVLGPWGPTAVDPALSHDVPGYPCDDGSGAVARSVRMPARVRVP